MVSPTFNFKAGTAEATFNPTLSDSAETSSVSVEARQSDDGDWSFTVEYDVSTSGDGSGEEEPPEEEPSPEPDRTLTVDGTNADRTDYTFTVSGALEPNPEMGGTGTGDTIDGSTASGFVNGGTDGYLFSGEVTDISVDGDAPFIVDGEEMDW